MTPQEKLAAELRAHASDCRKAADLNTDLVLQFDQLAAMAEAMDSAAATLLSEHGGGGEAEPVAWVPAAMLDKRVGQNFYTASRFQIDAVVPLYLHPPTPRAPVVDDALVERARKCIVMLRQHLALFAQDDIAQSLFAEADTVTAALSGVSAPVGVEGGAWTDADMQKPWGAESAFLRHLADDAALNAEQSMMLRHCAKRIESTAGIHLRALADMLDPAKQAGVLREAADALTPPAAAPSATDERGRPLTYWGGKPAAAPRVANVGCQGNDGLLRVHAENETCDVCTPAASADGLPELPAGFQWDEGRDITGEPWLSIKASDGTTAWSGDPHGDEANHMFDLIRRLAASGQGVEWQPIESAPKDGTPVLLSAPGWHSPAVATYEDGQWHDFGFTFTPNPTHWMPLPAAPTQEKGNG